MSIILNDNIKISAGKPLDNKYLSSGNTSYSSISEVNTTIPIAQRHIGLTVNINNDEYWYSTGVTNTDLVLKTAASGSTINNVQNIGSGVGVFSGITNSGVINLRSLVGSGATTVSLSGDSLIINSTGGIPNLNDGILEYNTTGLTFQPYSAITNNVSFYYGNESPTGDTLLNLNAKFGVTTLNLSSGVTTGTTINIGDIYWNNEFETINVKQKNDVDIPLGQSLVSKVYNETAGLIPKGTVIHITGSNNGMLTIEPARASNLDTDIIDEVVGITLEDIPASSDGFIISYGVLKNVNTSGYTENDILYLSPTIWGGVINSEPDYPNYAIQVGFIKVVDELEGEIFVRVSNVSKTENIRGVEIVDPPFTASTRSEIISVIGSGNITLPETPVLGQEITVQDHNGSASETEQIVILGNGKTISGETEAIINTSYGAFKLQYQGSNWVANVITA